MSQSSSGEAIVLLAATIASTISQDMSPEEIRLLIRLCNAVCFNLEIIAANKITLEIEEIV